MLGTGRVPAFLTQRADDRHSPDTQPQDALLAGLSTECVRSHDGLRTECPFADAGIASEAGQDFFEEGGPFSQTGSSPRRSQTRITCRGWPGFDRSGLPDGDLDDEIDPRALDLQPFAYTRLPALAQDLCGVLLLSKTHGTDSSVEPRRHLHARTAPRRPAESPSRPRKGPVSASFAVPARRPSCPEAKSVPLDVTPRRNP